MLLVFLTLNLTSCVILIHYYVEKFGIFDGTLYLQVLQKSMMTAAVHTEPKHGDTAVATGNMSQH